jgi:hypothetical protein
MSSKLLQAGMLLILLTGCQALHLNQTGTAGGNLAAGSNGSVAGSSRATDVQPDRPMLLATAQLPLSVSTTGQPTTITAPPEGIQSAPPSVTAPPQGITAPPLGIQQPLARSVFDYYDRDHDQHWNKAEMGTYVQDWRSQSAGFATQALTLDLLGNLDQLLASFDLDHDQLLDFAEASALHASLGQLYLQTHATAGTLTGNLTSAAGQTTSQAINTVNSTTSTVSNTVTNTTNNLTGNSAPLASVSPSTPISPISSNAPTASIQPVASVLPVVSPTPSPSASGPIPTPSPSAPAPTPTPSPSPTSSGGCLLGGLLPILCP